MTIQANFIDNFGLFYIRKMIKITKNRRIFLASAGPKIKIVHILLHVHGRGRGVQQNRDCANFVHFAQEGESGNF